MTIKYNNNNISMKINDRNDKMNDNKSTNDKYNLNYTFNSSGILVNLSIINLLSLKFLILSCIILLVNNF